MDELLSEKQREAVKRLRTGSVLNGGVGTGKSRVALAYFKERVCGLSGYGKAKVISNPMDLYVITTAKKRDDLEWEGEMARFGLPDESGRISVKVDSWNNIKKYVGVEGAFFIFDEQRLLGTGAWVKSFYKIAAKNEWILLTATPGDRWIDFAPIFIANGYYKHITDFRNKHVEYDAFKDYPMIKRYLNVDILEKVRSEVVVPLESGKDTTQIHKYLKAEYDSDIYETCAKKLWNVYKDEPIESAAELCYTLRKIVNSDPSRVDILDELANAHPRLIVFYNFDYELDILTAWCEAKGVAWAQWNGHKHQPIPDTTSWVYLVQYTSGCEGWNCTATDAMAFYSQNYSWRVMDQAAGRIDRINTLFKFLTYYHLTSDSDIDKKIERAVKKKKSFNETNYARSLGLLKKEKTTANSRE